MAMISMLMKVDTQFTALLNYENIICAKKIIFKIRDEIPPLLTKKISLYGTVNESPEMVFRNC